MSWTLHRRWYAALTAVTALLYAWVGLSTDGLGRASGLLGAVAILAALAVGRRSWPTATALLVVGAVPFAVVTWWSIATPVLAVVCVLVGWRALVGRRRVVIGEPR